MSHWTPKVDARVRLARRLKDKLPKKVKLTDLDRLITHGEAAKKADEEQRAQLASASVDVNERSKAAAAVIENETEIRDTVPAVIADLETHGNHRDALFLARLSFARFRVRELASTAADATGTAADADAVKRVERVEREDYVTRASGLAAFIDAVLAPGREALAAAFAERELDAAQLGQMRTAAAELAALGK
ncbi:MAG: hypothetical protein U0235_35615, partial [Polyangiaceae bacterium]